MLRRASVRLLAMCVLTTVAACTFDRQVIAVPPSEVVVHSVLDPGDTLVEVLLERSLSGAITVPKVRFDPLDPINTGGGVPAKGAQVSITGPDGTTPGFEIAYPGKASTYGAGRYVFRRLLVRPGAKYVLNIRTTDGIVVTGSTVVPASAAVTPVQIAEFYRDRDTLSLQWSPVPTARTYGVRIDSPFGAFQLFSDSTTLTLAGNLRNIFASDLPRVFIPGFEQAITIYAADTNFFDYYRSRNDPFTGSGIINRLDGGIGLFGSTVMISTRTVYVDQATTDSVFEGIYQVVSGAAIRNLVNTMRVYVETPATATLGAALSGFYSSDPTFLFRDGIVGTRDDNRIVLQFVANQVAGRERGTFTGRQSHDSLIGTFAPVNGDAEQVVFKKRLTP